LTNNAVETGDRQVAVSFAAYRLPCLGVGSSSDRAELAGITSRI